MTYEEILNRMLSKVHNDIDKREGSIIYDALAPAAAELAEMYIQLEYFDMYSFADKASDEYLTMRCAERGINRKQSTKAIRKGLFNIEVPIGSRFLIKDTTYKVIERIDKNEYKLECEQKGTIGNVYSGKLTTIDFINGLESESLTDILIPGEDTETDEQLRKRYFDSLVSEAFGGNIADYKEKVNNLDGVGGVKVYPVWKGAGTVKLVIIDSNYNKPSDILVGEVQTAIDPLINQGKGIGIAPIGHIVTVEGVSEVNVNIQSNITLLEGFVWEDVVSNIATEIKKYLNELKIDWQNQQSMVVRVSQIESSILKVTGVLDIKNTTLNDQATNLILLDTEIPKYMDVINNV